MAEYQEIYFTAVGKARNNSRTKLCKIVRMETCLLINLFITGPDTTM